MAEKPKPQQYNTFFSRKDDDSFVRPGVSEVSDATLRAYEELESITSMEQFIQICAEQKRKRGW